MIDKYKMNSFIPLRLGFIYIFFLMSALIVSTCQGLPGPKGIKGEPFYGNLPGHRVSSFLFD